MDLHLKNDAEHIRDLEGDKLQADAANLLKALDKLLTLGAYYSTGHEQYRQASQKAARTIQQAISPRKSMVLEITSNGVLILEQKIDPRHRNLRQLHDLLVPLNIARLEFDALVTAADLRQALAAFNDAKLDLSQCESFHEVVVKGLPGTIRTDVKSVQQAGDSS